MPVRLPSSDELRRLAQAHALSLDASDAASFLELMQPFAAIYAALDALPDEPAAPRYPRDAGARPSAEENPYNAWHVKTRVRGAASGPLAGRTVALKDNVMLAGVPLLNGAAIFEGYVPDVDASVVTRILDAGGEIAGKAHCECLCASAGSHTCAAGPVHNPHRRGFSAGGSSSGSAVLVAAGDVDMAIGGDQGGSIRIPAALCGVCGMKPTHGLVPYTGIVPIEPTLDHAGPITRTVRDNALLLEVIAGPDGIDPRQHTAVTHPYVERCEGGVGGLRVGVLREGFGLPNADPHVEAKVHQAARLLEKLGAVVCEVSVPEQRLAGLAFVPLLVEGSYHTLAQGDGFGAGRSDAYVTSLMDHLRAARARSDELHVVVKTFLLSGAAVVQQHGYRYYGKAMRLRRRVRAAYDRALSEVDVLLLPTTPRTATPLPPADADPAELLRCASDQSGNTFVFDLTHHPALSVPCGCVDGLPVGMMLVGRHWDEPSLYRTAHAFEQAEDWRAL